MANMNKKPKKLSEDEIQILDTNSKEREI